MCSSDIYHEKQIRELCALHALNNLFQSKEAFTKSELDVFCHSLSPDHWINPHKSALGLGNYDINVIMKALQSKGFEAIWFDKRKDPSSLNTNNITGFILNIPNIYKFSFVTLPLRRRHWLTIKEFNGIFYNLDSKIEAPMPIGKQENLISYLKEELDCNDKELFIVVTNQVYENESWLIDKSSYCNSVVSNSDRDAEVLLLKDIPNDSLGESIKVSAKISENITIGSNATRP